MLFNMVEPIFAISVGDADVLAVVVLNFLEFTNGQFHVDLITQLIAVGFNFVSKFSCFFCQFLDGQGGAPLGI